MEFHPIIVAAAFGVIVAGAVSDYRQRKITNRFYLAAAGAGLLLQTAFNGLPGLAAGASGLVVGLLLMFLPFAAGMIGGGDVKFSAAVGTYLGWKVLVVGLFAGVILGGVTAAGSLLKSGRFVTAMKSLFADLVCLSSGVRPTTLKTTQAVETVPYGVLLAMGMAGALTATLLRWVP